MLPSKQEKLKRKKNELKDDLSAVGVVGVREVFQDKPFRRAFWSVLILAATIFFCYHLSQRIKYFLEEPTNTEFTEEYGEVPLPTITLCNKNLFLETDSSEGFMHKAHELMKTFIWEKFKDEPNGSIPKGHVLLSGGIFHDWLTVFNKDNINHTHLSLLLGNRREDYHEFRHKIIQAMIQNPQNFTKEEIEGFTWEGMLRLYGHMPVIVSCYKQRVPCTESSMNVTFLNKMPYGKCINLNSNGSVNQTIAGKEGGIILEPVPLSILYPEKYHPFYGFDLFLHDTDEMPLYAIPLDAGRIHDITVTLTEIIKIKKCGKRHLKHLIDNKYSSVKCLYDVMLDIQYEDCGCYMPGMLGKEKNECLPDKWACVGEVFVKMAENNTTHFNEMFKNCITPCHQIKFNEKVISTELKNIKESEIWRNNKMEVYIHYNALYRSKYEEKLAFDWLGMLSDIGGASGLFFGACFFTILQFLDVGVRTVLFHLLWKCKNLKNSSKSEAGSRNTTESSISSCCHNRGEMPYDFFKYRETFQFQPRNSCAASTESSYADESKGKRAYIYSKYNAYNNWGSCHHDSGSISS